MITTQHIQFFEAQDNVWVEDMYGSGEALFARKFSDQGLDLVDRIDEMISRKEQRDLACGRSRFLKRSLNAQSDKVGGGA